MQTLDAERALASLDRDSIKETVLKLLDHRQRDDRQAMLKLADPNVVYDWRGSQDVYPFFGRREGIGEIARMLDHISTEWENKGSRVVRLVVEGNDVAVQRTTRLRHRGTNAEGDVDIVNFLRFREGRVIEISELVDHHALGRLANPSR